jgi:hypothetical protein
MRTDGAFLALGVVHFVMRAEARSEGPEVAFKEFAQPAEEPAQGGIAVMSADGVEREATSGALLAPRCRFEHYLFRSFVVSPAEERRLED